ncbi:MAG: prolyl oligopeptidase family serine peptidase [Lachnospiraceae bacterium]
MKLKKLLALLLMVCIVQSLAACNSSEPTSENAELTSENSESTSENEDISADDAIVGVSTMGFVDLDGAKVSAIVVEYNVDLEGAQLSADTYEIEDYGINQGDSKCELGENPGIITNVYVNSEPAVSESGGSGSGNYVIIEVNTDYQLSTAATTYMMAMIAGVIQTGTITADSITINPSSQKFINYEEVEYVKTDKETGEIKTEIRYYAIDGAYSFEGLDMFKMDTYSATDCCDEADGELHDVELNYAIYVPEDYDPNKEYALVLHVHDAGSLGADPMLALTKAKGPVNLVSDRVQELAKDQGLGGMIVVVPSIPTEIRSTRDNYSISSAVPATWQLMDYLTEEYNIDMNRIYGTGQSMGGMQVVAMAAQRDNYFAALLPLGTKWGNNFNKDEEYEGASYFTSTDATIWDVDADGNSCDWQNWYYMISDDNILWMNCASDPGSTLLTNELKYLYLDLAGQEIPYAIWNPLTTTSEERDEQVKALTEQYSDIGFYWAAFEGGSHNSTWIYAHSTDYCYVWLLNQTRESEQARNKLPLNNPFEVADEQIETEDRIIFVIDENDPSRNMYFVTSKYGAGTANYNTGIYGIDGEVVIKQQGAAE